MKWFSRCKKCNKVIIWQSCPTGGWWYHRKHPLDAHTAESDYDPKEQMDDDGKMVTEGE